MKKYIIITCRLNSQRLPLKALRKINDKEFIVHIFDRLKSLKLKKFHIILSTTKNKEDDLLVDLAIENKIVFFRGEDVDVFKRIVDTMRKFSIDNAILTTGDNIFIDIDAIIKLDKFHLNNENDFSYTHGLSWGTFTYAINFKAASKLCKIKNDNDTELWHDYFKKINMFKSSMLIFNKDTKGLSLRLTTDESKDLELIKIIFKKLEINYNNIPTDTIISFLLSNKKLILINNNIQIKKQSKLILKDRYKKLL